MTIQLRRLASSEYPVEPGLYLCKILTGHQASSRPKVVEVCDTGIGCGFLDGQHYGQDMLPDGIAWSERIECEVVG